MMASSVSSQARSPWLSPIAMMSYLFSIGSDAEGVVAYQFELVCGHMSDDAIIVQDYGEHIIAECAAIPDID
jgi:hypothetical protein